MRKILTLTLMLVWGQSQANNEVTIAGDNWCPINCGANDENPGFMIEVAQQALAQSGYKVKYIEMPWTRAVGLARKGEINAIVGAFVGDAPDFHFPQFPLLKISSNNLFTRVGQTWRYDGMSSLNKVTLGTIKGYDYGESLNNYINSVVGTEHSNVIQIYGNDAVKRSIQFLQKGRIDVLIESGPVFWYQAKQLNVTEQLQSAGSISPPKDCFIAFSPSLDSSKALSLALDKGIITLKQEYKYQVIADKYGLPKESI